MAKTTEAQIKVSIALQELASAIDNVLTDIAGVPMGFCLIVFNEQDDSYSNYVANTERAPTKEALKALLQYWENNNPDIPTHERH